MKVFTLWKQEWEGSSLVEVYATREAAIKHDDLQFDDRGIDYDEYGNPDVFSISTSGT